MKKIIMGAVAVCYLALYLGEARAAVTDTKSFRISVTLPAAVAINEKEIKSTEEKILTEENKPWDLIVEKVIRHSQPVILNTFVAK